MSQTIKTMDSPVSARMIHTPDEMKRLTRGAVMVSDKWVDAFSYAGTRSSPMRLLNVATGVYTSPAELGEFFPVEVVYEFRYAA